MPVLLGLLASLLWGTADFLGGTASRRLRVSSVVGVSQLVALVGLVPVALLTGALDEPRDYVLPGVAAGLIGPLALAAFYRALSLGTMGVVAPVAALGVVVPVVVGLVGGESPGALQLAGIAAAVVGVVLASGPELKGGSGRSLVLASLAAVGFGAIFLLLAEGSQSGSLGAVVMTLLTMRLTTVLLLAVLALRAGRSDVRAADLPVLAVIGMFDVGANAAFALASQSDLISVTAVLASLYPVVTVLLARQLQGERLVGPQLPGVVLALVGVLLLAGG